MTITTDEDERRRISQYVQLLRASMCALDIALRQDVPIGGDTAQNIAALAVQISMTISRADAYRAGEKR